MIQNGNTVVITGTNDEFDGAQGVVNGIHPIGTYPNVKEPVFMVYVGDEYLGDFGETELEVIG